jgi:hypothetical protein
MSPGHGTRWILTGALAICLAIASFPVRKAVADDGIHKAVSRGERVLPGRNVGLEQDRTAQRDRNDASGWGAGLLMAQVGKVTPEKLTRWRTMTPEERERYRKRHRRWKKLPPDRRKRILERRRRWRKFPEGQRRFLKERREIYRNAWPEEKRAIEKFARRWRQLPPERRHSMRRRLSEMRNLPAAERDERLMDWKFYRRLTPPEKKAVSRFLFSKPPSGPRGGPSRSPRD